MDDLDTHPSLQNLLQASNEPHDVAMFVGYCGPSPQSQSHVRLYTSLEDLSTYVEIARADIVHRERATDGNAPDSIWVKAAASIRVVRDVGVRDLASEQPVGPRKKKLRLSKETIATLDVGALLLPPTTGGSVGCVSIDNPTCVCQPSRHIC